MSVQSNYPLVWFWFYDSQLKTAQWYEPLRFRIKSAGKRGRRNQPKNAGKNVIDVLKALKNMKLAKSEKKVLTDIWKAWKNIF